MSETEQAPAATTAPTSAPVPAPGEPFFPAPATSPQPSAPTSPTPTSPLDHLAAHPEYADDAAISDNMHVTYGADGLVNTEGANARARSDLTWRPGEGTMIKTGVETTAGTDGVGGTGTLIATHSDDELSAGARAALTVTPEGTSAGLHGRGLYNTPDLQLGVHAGASGLGTDTPNVYSGLQLGIGDPSGLSIQMAAQMQNMTDDEKRAFVARTQMNIPITDSTSAQPHVGVQHQHGQTTVSTGVDVTQQLTPSVAIQGGVAVENIGGPGGPAVVPSGGVIVTPQDGSKPAPTGPLPVPSF